MAMFPVSIVSPTAVRRWGDDFEHHPVGTGPFAFESWEQGQAHRARAPRRLLGRRAGVRRIVFQVIADRRQRLIALESGSVDLAMAILPEELQFVELHPDLELHKTPANNVTYLAMNTDPPAVRRRAGAARRELRHQQGADRQARLPGPGDPGRRAAAADPVGLPQARASLRLRSGRGARAARRGRGRRQLRPDQDLHAVRRRRRRGPTCRSPSGSRASCRPTCHVGIKTELVLQPYARPPSARCRTASTTCACSAGSATTATPTTSSTCCSTQDNAVKGAARNVAFFRDPVRPRPAGAGPGSPGPRTSASSYYARAQD